jgi:LacI family transcriptional regulator/LacI family repressor for deo operon, udp, cdd, tsx, nupC, and nupG
MASLTDVARIAGVSIATVSRVISHPDKVNRKTQARVRKVMEDLNYRPNRVARRLRQRGGRRHLLGLIIPDIQNPFFAEIARGVEDAAYANQFAVILCNSDEDIKKEAFYLDVMRDESVDGIILPPINESDSAVLKCAESGMPMVSVDRSLANSPIDQVEVDNRLGAYEAVEHLIKLNHRRIGIITGRLNVSTSRERKLGHDQALAAYGLPVKKSYMRVGDYKQASGYALAEELLALADRPSALFVLNNLMVVGAIEAIHKRGLKIPQDVAIIGFDDLPWAEALDPPLTVVRQPTYEVGQAAVDLLLKRLETPKAPAVSLRLRPQLILRRSC